MRPSTILLVTTDRERADLPASLPLPGHERPWRAGMRPDNFHVHTTPCSPSRSNPYFGQHTQRTGMVVNLGVFPEPEIPPGMPGLGDHLRANGCRRAFMTRH